MKRNLPWLQGPRSRSAPVDLAPYLLFLTGPRHISIVSPARIFSGSRTSLLLFSKKERPMRWWIHGLMLLAFGGLLCVGCLDFDVDRLIDEKVDYQAPAEQNEDDGLADDALADNPAVAFDPELVDRRPANGFLINASSAVVKLDVLPVKPDKEADYLVLHPSYAAAVAAVRAKHPGVTVLPSVNQIDNKAKQFDDGLYAALDQAYFQNMLSDQLHGYVDLV